MSDNHAVVFGLTTRSFPSNGVRAIQKVFDFTNGVTQVIGDFLLEQESGEIDFIQALKIDNSGNAFAFDIVFPGLGTAGDHTIAAPNTILICPILVPQQAKVSYVATSAGGVKVPVSFLNVEMPYIQWNATAQKSGIITGTQTNHSGTNTGASIAAIPANANRLAAVIQNPQANANSMWINFGAPAVADNTSQEIAPGQQFNTANGPLDLGAINIIGTNGDKFYATELHS